MKIPKITPTGKESSVLVKDEIFAIKPNLSLLAQADRVYLSNQRQSTSKVKTRSEVARTTAKWYKQKGTGRARHGSRNAPIFVGGGVAHGPTGLENWKLFLPSRLKALALKSALSAQIKVIVVSDIPLETEGKTKHAKRFIDLVKKKDERCLIVYNAKKEVAIKRSFANLQGVLLVTSSLLTAHHILSADKVVFTTSGLSSLTDRLLPETHQEKADSLKPSIKTQDIVEDKKPAKLKKLPSVKTPSKKPKVNLTKKAPKELKQKIKSTKKVK